MSPRTADPRRLRRRHSVSGLLRGFERRERRAASPESPARAAGAARAAAAPWRCRAGGRGRAGGRPLPESAGLRRLRRWRVRDAGRSAATPRPWRHRGAGGGGESGGARCAQTGRVRRLRASRCTPAPRTSGGFRAPPGQPHPPPAVARPLWRPGSGGTLSASPGGGSSAVPSGQVLRDKTERGSRGGATGAPGGERRAGREDAALEEPRTRPGGEGRGREPVGETGPRGPGHRPPGAHELVSARGWPLARAERPRRRLALWDRAGCGRGPPAGRDLEKRPDHTHSASPAATAEDAAVARPEGSERSRRTESR